MQPPRLLGYPLWSGRQPLLSIPSSWHMDIRPIAIDGVGPCLSPSVSKPKMSRLDGGEAWKFSPWLCLVIAMEILLISELAR